MSDITLLNELTIPLRWMDMDAYAHVGNARYYDFMTDARVDLFEKEKTLDDLTIQYVVVESGCTFKHPIVYPGNIVLKQYCLKIGKSSFTLAYEFYSTKDKNKICAEGHVIMACYNAKLKKAVRIPEEIRYRLLKPSS